MVIVAWTIIFMQVYSKAATAPPPHQPPTYVLYFGIVSFIQSSYSCMWLSQKKILIAAI